MKDRYEEICRLGGQLLVVSFSRPDRLAAYLARFPLPFPVVADPGLAAYKTFELGRTSWRGILRPRLLVRYLKLRLRSRLTLLRYQGEDVFQLGGDFVLDSKRRLVFAHRSEDPTDRPPAETLVQAIRAVVEQNHGSMKGA